MQPKKCQAMSWSPRFEPKHEFSPLVQDELRGVIHRKKLMKHTSPYLWGFQIATGLRWCSNPVYKTRLIDWGPTPNRGWSNQEVKSRLPFLSPSSQRSHWSTIDKWELEPITRAVAGNAHQLPQVPICVQTIDIDHNTVTGAPLNLGVEKMIFLHAPMLPESGIVFNSTRSNRVSKSPVGSKSVRSWIIRGVWCSECEKF